MNFDPYDGTKYTIETKEHSIKIFLYDLLDLSKDLKDDFFNPLRPDNPGGTWHLPHSENLANKALSNEGFTSLLRVNPAGWRSSFIKEYKRYLDLLKEQQWEYDVHWGVLEYEN